MTFRYITFSTTDLPLWQSIRSSDSIIRSKIRLNENFPHNLKTSVLEHLIWFLPFKSFISLWYAALIHRSLKPPEKLRCNYHLDT